MTIDAPSRPLVGDGPAHPVSSSMPPPARIRFSSWTMDNVAPLISAVIGSLCLSWLVFERLLPWSGVIGFWVFAYAMFIATYALVLRLENDWPAVRDRIALVMFSSAGLVLVVGLAMVVIFVAVRGIEAISHANFWTETTAMIGPDDPLDKGGVYAAMVGTFEQVLLAMIFSVPLGFCTAIYLNEARGPFARVVRTVVDAMTAIPTIVAGLFIFAVVILTLGFQRSGLAASLALSVEMLPVVTRTTEVVLRLVPNGLREASYAMGASRSATMWKVVLPTARAGLVTAVLLGVARVIGETSPVLLTAGFTNELNYNAASGPQVSLPLFVFSQVRYPLDNAIARAFGAALVLLVLVLIFFTAARVIGGRPPGQPRRKKRANKPTGRTDSPDSTIYVRPQAGSQPASRPIATGDPS